MHIKRFIDKVSVMESRQNKDVVLPMQDARGLRDELSKLLADLHTMQQPQKYEEPSIKIEMKGGSFK